MLEEYESRESFYGRPRAFIVFISSKMAGGTLTAEREAAIAAVEEFRPARAWAWEKDAPAGSFYSEEECVERARTSDALVLIVEDELTPVTRKEFEAAEKGAATVIVLARRGIKRTPELTRFISHMRGRTITKEFSDLDELKAEVDLALWEWFVRGGRTLGLQVQEQRRASTDLSLLESAELTRDGSTSDLRQELKRLRSEVEEGNAEEAMWEIYGWAATATAEDHFPLAALLLDQLREIIPSDSIDEVARGWILNLEGRIASGRGNDDAVQYFEQMRQIGKATDEPELVATAYQNLGVQAVIAGEHAAAKKYFRSSFELKRETGDAYGSIQIALNMCNVFLGEGSFKVARELLDDLEPYICGPESAGLRASISGQRGLILSREGRFDEARTEFGDSLRHARRAQSGGRQVLALQNLGANSMERGKPYEAMRWYRKAESIAQSLGDRYRLRILADALGSALAKAEKWEEAAEEFARAARLAESLGDLPSEVQAWANVGACWLQLGRPEEALRLIDQALSNPQASGSPDSRASQLRNLGEVLERLGKPEEALRRLDEAARLAEDVELKDSSLQRGAEIALGHPGLGDQADGFLQRSLDLQRDTGTSVDAAWRAAMIGAQLSGSSQAAAAPRYFTLALRVFARNGDRRRAFYTRNDRGIALSNTGALTAAVHDMKAALAIAQEIGDWRLQFQAEMNLGELERRRKNLGSSEAHLQNALERAERANDDLDRAAVLNLLGLMRVDMGDLNGAERSYQDALELGKRLKDKKTQADAFGGLAGIAFRRGRYGEAERRFEQAIRQYGDATSTALVEDLGGLALSRASRGRVVEEEIQRLIDLSGRIGWDRNCAEEIADCGQALIAAGGDIEDAISLQAIAVTCALRSITANLGGDDDALIRLLVLVLAKGIAWMRVHPNYAAIRQQMVEEVIETLDVEAGELDFLEKMIAVVKSEFSDD
ncbi:MAG: tetratricopeptide repeat protein [Solirubrobacterales bacterium]